MCSLRSRAIRGDFAGLVSSCLEPSDSFEFCSLMSASQAYPHARIIFGGIGISLPVSFCFCLFAPVATETPISHTSMLEVMSIFTIATRHIKESSISEWISGGLTYSLYLPFFRRF